MAARTAEVPASPAPQTDFHALQAQNSTHPVDDAMVSTEYEPVPDKERRSLTNRRKWIIAGAIIVAVAAVVAVIVVLTQSDDDDSSDSTTITATTLLALPHVAVANVTMVDTSSEDESKDKCVELEWIPTGVELMASSGSTISYLCMQQSVEATETGEDVGSVDLDTISVVRRVVVVSDSCPSNMETLANPSANLFVCVEFVSASSAFDTQQYLVDLMTTTEAYYNHDTPGWVTWPDDLKMYSGAASVYLSARYPVRPIVGLEVLSDVSSDTIYSSCEELEPQGQWETPGFVLKSSEGASSNSDSSDVVVCVQRPLANETGSFSVLTDLTVVLPTDSCPEATNSANITEITSDQIKLCAEWDLVDVGNSSSISSDATSSFIAELALYETSGDEAVGLNISTAIPGNWNVIGNESTGTLQTFFLSRNFEPYVLNSTNSSGDDISSSVEAIASNSSETLSFKVLQIADMHLTGNPDYPCSSGPSSIRSSLLAAASVIAEELRKESNSSSSATAGEDSDPMYNECREAVTVAFLDELLDIEQPDFVVFTGDNVQTDLDTAMHTFAMGIFTARVESRGIPWSAVFGNHDAEGGLSREEMLDLMVEGKQYSHVKYGPRDIGGVGNYEVNVVAPVDGPWGAQGDTVFRMYFLDSHANMDTATYPLVNDPSDYDWIKETQIEFYRELAKSHAEGDNNSSQNGSVPAVMYYHIPVPEYALASPLNQIGDKNEAIASAAVNSGLFSALVEVGDVKATFVGHDHINEYCYSRQGVQLCYGGGIGMGRAYGLTSFERRARVLEWTFNANQTRSLQSWKRHLDDPTQIQSLEVLYSE
ncbi:putative inactive purple acid phosphatase 29 [Phytophthora citrophthora]|uniref:Inactive purple acid phosphatase 29 n=1 Tax=Phytophthora citrophthora TaxID=4793 RepID=A0AAD9H175_9STRA|nr:putative inactive purple acid phosphatase 29 [Phytophthora citrophthora]